MQKGKEHFCFHFIFIFQLNAFLQNSIENISFQSINISNIFKGNYLFYNFSNSKNAKIKHKNLQISCNLAEIKQNKIEIK